jgi:chemotaxis protein CheX
MAALAEPPVAFPGHIAEPELTKAVIGSVYDALRMCNAKARCVAVACVPGSQNGALTGMIGVYGKVSGFVTVNLAERLAVRVVGGLLQETCGKLSSQVVDGVAEITNIIVGGVKKQLSGGPWSFSQLTIPSVIVGKGYHISYARGLAFLCATFECEDGEAVVLEDRLMQVSLSFLKV